MLAKRVFVLFVLLVLTGCGSSGFDDAAGLDLERRIDEYVAASNAHDADALLALLTEDARWQIPTRKETIDRDMMRVAVEMDTVLNTQIEVRNCTIRGLIATCESIERNDWLSLHGIDKWEQPQLRFVFTEEGLIRFVKWIGKDEAALAELRSGGMAFRSWALADEEREKRYQSMLDETGEQLRWDRPTAETLMSLGEAWVEAGRPGLEEARQAYAEKMESYAREQERGKAGEADE